MRTSTTVRGVDSIRYEGELATTTGTAVFVSAHAEGWDEAISLWDALGRPEVRAVPLDDLWIALAAARDDNRCVEVTVHAPGRYETSEQAIGEWDRAAQAFDRGKSYDGILAGILTLEDELKEVEA